VRGAVRVATLALALVLVLSACFSSGPSATGGAPASTSLTTGSVSSTTSGTQTGGLRTVLSPGGLNIRAQPSRSAPIRGTAAQATELAVLAHTDQGGGWFQVKGSTVTGWISDNSTLSAPGKFAAYYSSDHQFGALYPDSWTVAESPPASVVFRPKSGSDTVVATTASTVVQLGRGRAGYRQSSDQQVVVCGVTSDLLTFVQESTPSTSTPEPGGVVAGRYLAQVHLTLDAQHALGIDANLGDTSQLQTVRDFLSSVKFAFPQCQR
jgi:Bacterial SH3 domain